MEWHEVVARTAGVAAISWQQGIEDEQQQRMLASVMTETLLYGPALIYRLDNEEHRTIFTREGLLALLRLAVTEGSSGVLAANFADCFMQATLIVNELLADEITPSSSTGSPTDLLPSELRSALLHLQNPHDLLGRTDAFFEWSRTPKAGLSRSHMPVEDDFRRFTGLTFLEYAAGAYAALTRCSVFRTWSDVEQRGISFDLDDWLANLSNKSVLTQWIAASTVAISTARAQWQEESSLSIAGAGALWRHPIVEADDGRFFIPSPLFILNAMSDGAYFVLFNGYGDDAKDDSKKLQFSQFYGEFFEDYVVGRITSGYANRVDVSLVSREIEYAPGVLSTDLFVAEANDVLFIEVVKKRMSLIGSVLRLNDETIRRDLEAGVLDKARQLHRNVEDFRSGKLFPDVPRPRGQRIFPILVAPEDWPRIYVLTDLFEKVRRDQGLLANAEPIELLDASEVEALEPVLRRGLRLGELLDRKNKGDASNRLMSLHNYELLVEPGTYGSEMTPTRERGGRVAQQIIELVKSWMN